jgi:hypothetical protein
MFDDKGNGLFSTVLLDWIEWEGPLVSEAEKSRRNVGLVPPDDATPEVVAEHLQRFAERAWRRPVKKEELAEYLQSYRAEREAGEKMADAYPCRVAGRADLPALHLSRRGRPVAREASHGHRNSPRGSRISCGVRCPTTVSSPRPKAAR